MTTVAAAVTADPRGPAAAFDQAAAGNVEARKLESYPALDWLRMGLAGLVAINHFGVVLPAPFDGHFGVEAFLALSGWLIGGILIRSSRSDLPRFFFNRATRIWLPYAAAIIILYGLALVREGLSVNWLKYLFYDVSFTHFTFVTFPRAITEMPLGGSGNQFWSLAVEEQFYLLAPLFMFVLPFGKALWGWLVLGVAAVAAPLVAAPLVLGVVAAILQRDHGDWHLTRIGRPLVILGTIVAGIVAHWLDTPPPRSLFATGIILALAFPGRRGPVGLFLGGLSYPFYLNHWMGGFIAHGIAKRVPMPLAVSVILAFALAFAISSILWWLVDRPVLERRLGWYSPALGRKLAIAAYAIVLTGLAGGLIIARAGG